MSPSAVKKASATSTRRRSTTKPKPVVKVRMYNVGFGDAFVVIFPGATKEHYVLVDCGTLSGGGKKIDDVAANIVADCAVNGKTQFDVVIATHRHRDHISGFGSPIWRDVEVGEVWMPWTENTKDKHAREIRDRQIRLTDSLEKSVTFRLKAAPLESDPFGLIVLNAKLDDRAMETLQRGFLGKPKRRYLPYEDESLRTFTTDSLPEVAVHVLGPSRSEEVIRDIDPPKGESYLRMANRAGIQSENIEPFGAEWWIEPDEFLSNPEWGHLRLDTPHREAISRIGDDTDPALAVALDKALNGTSLVLVLEFRGVRLLFTGDAQWGTWNAILNDTEWRDLLEQVSFWKVGHHGSHNGTPKEFVDRFLKKDTMAMVSTLETTRWPSIPRAPLMQAIKTKTTLVARSDDEKNARKPFVPMKGSYIEAVIPCS